MTHVFNESAFLTFLRMQSIERLLRMYDSVKTNEDTRQSLLRKSPQDLIDSGVEMVEHSKHTHALNSIKMVLLPFLVITWFVVMGETEKQNARIALYITWAVLLVLYHLAGYQLFKVIPKFYESVQTGGFEANNAFSSENKPYVKAKSLYVIQTLIIVAACAMMIRGLMSI